MASLGVFKERHAQLKLVQFVLGIILVSLLGHYYLFRAGKNLDQILFISLATVSCFMITTLSIIGYIMDNNYQTVRHQEIVACVVGTAMQIATGAIVIDNLKNGSGEVYSAAMAYGSLSIINAIVYGVDAFFTCRSVM